jgi:hypothetical protein
MNPNSPQERNEVRRRQPRLTQALAGREVGAERTWATVAWPERYAVAGPDDVTRLYYEFEIPRNGGHRQCVFGGTGAGG